MQARVLLSLGKRARAAAELEPLQAHLGQLPDDLATRLMLLLADIHLGGGSPVKAAGACQFHPDLQSPLGEEGRST